MIYVYFTYVNNVSSLLSFLQLPFKESEYDNPSYRPVQNSYHFVLNLSPTGSVYQMCEESYCTYSTGFLDSDTDNIFILVVGDALTFIDCETARQNVISEISATTRSSDWGMVSGNPLTEGIEDFLEEYKCDSSFYQNGLEIYTIMRQNWRIQLSDWQRKWLQKYVYEHGNEIQPGPIVGTEGFQYPFDPLLSQVPEGLFDAFYREVYAY